MKILKVHPSVEVHYDGTLKARLSLEIRLPGDTDPLEALDKITPILRRITDEMEEAGL